MKSTRVKPNNHNCLSAIKCHFTCGVSSTSSSPERYWRSNSAFSPTYEDIIRLIYHKIKYLKKDKVSSSIGKKNLVGKKYEIRICIRIQHI